MPSGLALEAPSPQVQSFLSPHPQPVCGAPYPVSMFGIDQQVAHPMPLSPLLEARLLQDTPRVQNMPGDAPLSHIDCPGKRGGGLGESNCVSSAATTCRRLESKTSPFPTAVAAKTAKARLTHMVFIAMQFYEAW